MKIIELDFGFWIPRFNRINIGLVMIDVERLDLQSQPFQPRQKRLDMLFIPSRYFFRYDNSSMLILEN